jgi:hypothetical protein
MTKKKYFPDPPTNHKDDLHGEGEHLNDQWKGGSTTIRPAYYAKYKIDPWTFCIENDVSLSVGSVIKYIMRFQDKNGEEDLNKAIKCIEMMKEYYYGKS